jgi:hypothetical protein
MFMNLAEYIGFKSESSKADFIKTTVFYAAFFYTGLQSFVASINFRSIEASSGSKGIYTDFNSYWFKDIGFIMIYNMVYNVFWPIMEFFIYYLLRHLYRMCDQKKFWPNDVYKTNCKTIYDFEAMYCGYQFYAHFKISFILNAIFCTFMYGAVLPILFPVCWCQLFVMYASERLLIHYSYTKPPMYDERLIRNTIRTLYVAPVLFFGVGAVAFSN